MRRVLVSFAICFSIVAATAAALGQEVGEYIAVVADKVEIKVGDRVVDSTGKGRQLEVRAVDGDLLQVSQGKPGWIHRRDVIPVDQAVDHFTAEIQRNSQDAAAYRARAIAFRQIREFDKAIEDHNTAIRLAPQSARAYTLRGLTWMRTRDAEKAIADFDEAIRLDPNNALAYSFRGFARTQKKQFDKALDDHHKAVELDPENARLYGIRGAVFLRKNDNDNALKNFQRAIELDPGRGRSYVNRAQVYLNQAQLKQAREDLDHAVQLSPKSARTHNQVAWFWATHPNERIRDGRKAVASATRACELTDWKDDMILDTLAAAYAENGNFDEAVKWQEKAQELATTEEFKKEYEDHLALYRAGKPCRDDPASR